MKKCALCLLPFAFAMACGVAVKPQTDQKKFEALFLAGKEVEADFNSETGPRKELLRRLKAEASMAESRASGDSEKLLVRSYGDAASMLLFAETIRESEQASGTILPASDPKSSLRFRRIGVEKLKLAQQIYLGK